MGARVSRDAGADPVVEKTQAWIVELGPGADAQYAGRPSLAVLPPPAGGGPRLLAAAWQASPSAPRAGAPSQHIAFATSADGGATWAAPRPIMWGLAPLWNPVLHYDAGSGALLCFYSESRKFAARGGDVKVVASADRGATWGPPRTIWAHEAGEEVPKVTSNRLAVAPDGAWVLPVHREPPGAAAIFGAGQFTELSDAAAAGGAAGAPPPPRGAPPQSLTTSAAVLVSRDAGATWAPGGPIEDARTWLVDGAVEVGAAADAGRLVCLLRSAVGRAYRAVSADGGATWSRARAVNLACPNARFSTAAIDGQLLAAHAAAPGARAPLALSISLDDGRSWEPLASVEADAGGCFSAPALVGWTDETVKVAYGVWEAGAPRGLRLSTLKLATVP